MTTSLDCGVYFADPYCSWQRGLNENTNWFITTILAEINRLQESALSEVQDVTVELNDRPRKKLNYKTPAKLMSEHMVAMAA